MKRLIVEFAGGKMDGKRYDTEAVGQADREAAVTYYQKTSNGQEGAVEFARPPQDSGVWQRYKVSRRQETADKVVVMLQYAVIE